MKKIKQISLNVTLLFAAICFVLLVGEIIVRTFPDEPDNNEWIGNPRSFYEHDSLLGWKHIPNTNTVRISIGGTNKVPYQINSRGIRGPEYPYEKAHNEYRILFLGDSYTEGYIVEFDDLFSEVMTSELNNKKKGIYFRAINSGTSGWSTDQELLFFQSEGEKYNPDLTILMFFQNDLAYNNQPKDFGMFYKPLFKKENGKLVLTNVPVPKPDKIVYDDQLNPEKESIFKKLKLWLHGKSRLYGFIKERVKYTYFLNNLAIKLHLKDKPEKEADSLRPREFVVWEKEYNESVRQSWQITEAMLIKLKEETDSIGSELLVFFVPHEGGVYQEVWSKIKENYGLSDEKWNIDQVGLELGAVCKRNSIDFINPTELFRSRAKELQKDKKLMYDPKDKHWNVEGNKFAGELLAEYIVSKRVENKK
jgi:hypothetical protein